jgi:hypothetical protein
MHPFKKTPAQMVAAVAALQLDEYLKAAKM